MKVGFYQFSPLFGKPQENLEKILSVLDKQDADLAVLPELALTGYFFKDKKEVLEMAEPVPGHSSEKLSQLAVKKDMAIVIGFAELAQDSENVYNSALLLTPDGETHVYRKSHLFHEEKLFFASSNIGFPTFTVKGVTVGLLVCFDHFFPEAARTLALKGADIICHPSNLVLPGKAQITTQARSVENKVFWVLANRNGTEKRGDESLSYSGCSRITDPEGRIMISVGEAEEGFFAIDIDPEKARDKSVTNLCSVIDDRRTEIYQL